MKVLFLLLFPALIFSQQLYTDSAGWINQKADASTGVPTMIMYEHHEIHSGSHYYLDGYSSVGNGDTLVFFLQTPNTTKWAHMLYSFATSKITTFEVFMSADSIPKGATSITPINSNHNYANASVLTVAGGTSLNGVFPLASLGTKIDSSKVGSSGARPSLKYGGAQSRGNETVLKQNTIYVYMFISGEAANTIDYLASWYEHTDKY